MSRRMHSQVKRVPSGMTAASRSPAAPILFLFILWLMILPCMVDGAEKKQDSFEIGGIYFRQANNFSTRSPARINDLNAKAPTESTTRPVVLFTLGTEYGKNNRLYLKSDIEQMENSTLSLGTQIPLTDRGNRLDIAVFTAPFYGEVWKNPYQTGSDREETEVIRYGLKIAMNDILGTSLTVRFTAFIVDVDDDEIGRMYRALRRDGCVYTVTGEYRFTLTSNLFMTPALHLTRGDFDGESNSFYRYGVGIKGMYTQGDMTFMPMIRYTSATYDENHPVFDTKRDDDHYLAALMATYSNPFGFQDFFIRLIGGYGKTESNITFCDATGKFLGLTVGYHF